MPFVMLEVEEVDGGMLKRGELCHVLNLTLFPEIAIYAPCKCLKE